LREQLSKSEHLTPQKKLPIPRFLSVFSQQILLLQALGLQCTNVDLLHQLI